ncbi:MAG TPA: AraC family transcriptional regulator [Spirochaetia bacterium]|nr:AraC family transcriptional regulator [Spirochaetia bacterium]
MSQDWVGRSLERVLTLIDTQYSRRLDIDALCDEAHFSRYHFIRTFRSRLRETPHQYLTRRRIDRARELLATTEMSITDICFDVGFESLGSFSALFHRAVGWSPSVYRARCVEQRRSPRKYIPACCWTMFGFEESTARN